MWCPICTKHWEEETISVVRNWIGYIIWKNVLIEMLRPFEFKFNRVSIRFRFLFEKRKIRSVFYFDCTLAMKTKRNRTFFICLGILRLKYVHAVRVLKCGNDLFCFQFERSSVNHWMIMKFCQFHSFWNKNRVIFYTSKLTEFMVKRYGWKIF